MRVVVYSSSERPDALGQRGEEPRSVTYVGDVAGAYLHPERGEVFIVWDAAKHAFRTVPIHACVVLR